MHWKSVARVVVAAAVMTGTSVAVDGASPNAVSAIPCESTSQNKFLGNGYSASGLKGVYSEIEYIDKKLCIQGTPRVNSWSLSWVSIDGPQSLSTPGIDIYQGGYADCPFTGTCPFNNGVSYIWYFYGHEQGACGLPFNSGVIKLQNATSGIHDFQISKVGARYNFYYDEVDINHISQADVETCWPGVAAVEWQNEMLNNADQGGGGLANRQDFRVNQYQNGTGWHPMNRTLGSLCDANSYPSHWHCRTSSTISNNFTSWDDRFP